jgi:hypothetical protein
MPTSDPVLISVEPFDERSPREVVELCSVGATAATVLDGLSPSEGVARIVRAREGEPPSGAPGVVVAVADLRVEDESALARLRHSNALSVAVVAVEPTSTDHLARSFDAVLRVPLHRDADAVMPLHAALMAVTAFARGSIVSLGVDDVYPFYACGGGELRFAVAEASAPAAAVREAVRSAGLSRRIPNLRLLVHIETDARVLDHMKPVGVVLRKLLDFEDIAVSASHVPIGAAKCRVSLVASVGGTAAQMRPA